MSFIYRDFYTPSLLKWNRASALYHKFDKVWGKSVVDGIEVYDSRLYYWNGSVRSDTQFKRFINALGIEYTTLQNASYKGVSNVYFTLDLGKYDYSAPEKAEVVEDLNSVFKVGDEFELYVHYTGESKRSLVSQWSLKPGASGTSIGDYTINTSNIRSTLHSDPIKYFANAKLEEAAPLTIRSNPAIKSIQQNALKSSPRSTPVTRVEYNEDTTHIYATLALLDNGSVFEQVGGIYDERTTVVNATVSNVYFQYSYKIKYRVKALATVDSYVVGQIDLVSNAMEEALGYNGSNVYAIENRATDTTLKEAVIAMNNITAVGLGYKGQLRVDVAAAMKRKDFASMLGKSFSTGYTKKKSKWYAKLLTVVIVVIAVVVFVITGGSGAAVSGNLIALSVALTAASATLTIGMLLYASAFPYATDQTKMIGNFAQIVGFAAMITGVMAAIQSSWQQYVRAEAAKIAAKESLGVATKEVMANALIQAEATATIQGYLGYMMDVAVESIINATNTLITNVQSILSPSTWNLSGLSNLTMTDVSGWMKNLDFGMRMYSEFFGQSKQYTTLTEEDQSTKENGVESVFLANSMIDKTDALERMDMMIKNNMGGQKTENFMAQIA